MIYTQIKAVCPSESCEEVCAIMSVLDTSLMIEDYSDIESMDTCYGELIDESLLRADREHAAVSLFLEQERATADALAFLRERFAAAGIDVTLEIAGADPTDWENEWKKYYHPVPIGQHMVIVPAWQEYTPESGQICVRMDSGAAFGTGTHETTRLCAALLESYCRPGDSVLDVGTGSGILAICAKKLGAGQVSGCDIDPVAVRVAGENAADNGEDIPFFVSDLLAQVDGTYDLVAANIVADILIRMAPDLPRVMKAGGKLIASGIIADREDEVAGAITAQGLRLLEHREENDWRALVFEAM